MMDRFPGSPLRLAVAMFLLAFLGGCATGSRRGAEEDVPRPPSAPDPRTSVLEGRIVYLPRIALAPRAVAKVWLQDMSEPGSPVPVILDEQVISPAGQVPIAFRLRYDPQSIRPERRYTLLVRIYEGDRVRFTNAQVYRVLTAGCTNGCEVLVDLMN
ncbi:MAG: YbaY family lipoprotein [Betaproteobacteria bacterium]